jgi:hypothetical protein
MWYIEDGFKFAKHWLEQCKIPATERLQLATLYKIRDWVTLAVQDLLRTPLSSLSNGDLDHIGGHINNFCANGAPYFHGNDQFENIVLPWPPSR